jgi:hypothetical protein
MNFQITATADSKLSYTPCYKYVKQKLYLIMNLDKDTKLSLLHKHYLALANDALDENYQHGCIMFLDEHIRNPNNKWKQHRVDEAIKIMDEYKQKRKKVIDGLL